MVSLPPTPIAGITYPKSDLISKAFAFINEHHNPTVANHAIRSSIYVLIIARKIPHLSQCSHESLALASLLHDLGWSTTPSLISADKRFEVDGANAAVAFLRSSTSPTWSDHHLQQIWYAIALHTTPSVSLHAEPFVSAVSYGIMADFRGPNMPGGLITVDEYKEIMQAYPRLDFASQLREISCGLCKNKPETTYDNGFAWFGVRDVPGYKQQWEKKNARDMLEGSLKACEEYDE